MHLIYIAMKPWLTTAAYILWMHIIMQISSLQVIYMYADDVRYTDVSRRLLVCHRNLIGHGRDNNNWSQRPNYVKITLWLYWRRFVIADRNSVIVASSSS